MAVSRVHMFTLTFQYCTRGIQIRLWYETWATLQISYLKTEIDVQRDWARVKPRCPSQGTVATTLKTSLSSMACRNIRQRKEGKSMSLDKVLFATVPPSAANSSLTSPPVQSSALVCLHYPLTFLKKCAHTYTQLLSVSLSLFFDIHTYTHTYIYTNLYVCISFLFCVLIWGPW